MKRAKTLYSLIPLDIFKAVTGVDDREDALARFCLTIATHTIEQYCRRRLLRKGHFALIEYTGDLVLLLREYPVKDVLAVYAMSKSAYIDGEFLEEDFYS